MTLITENETLFRLGVFFGVLVLMMALEGAFPRKSRVLNRTRRWSTNLLMVIAGSVVARLLVPVASVTVAVFAAQKGGGVLNLWALPLWLNITLSVIALDLLIYGQHVAFHKVPVLWALHKVHHADRDIDATTGVRFHPFEIIISLGIKFAGILVLGPSVIGVIIFEIVLNATAMFNHANMRLPLAVDRVLRKFIVTPDMHRVHHSIIRSETDSNYGFNLSVWDRIFSTYTAQPQKGHDDMTIGLLHYQTQHPAGIWWSLKLPFTRTKRRDDAKENS